MFAEPNNYEEAGDPGERAKEKGDEFRVHAQMAAVYEGRRKIGIRSFGFYRLLSSICAVLLLTASVAFGEVDDFGHDAYVLPLVGDYAVHKGGSFNPISQNGKFQLVRMMSLTSSTGFTFLVPDVQQVAVVNKIIFGRATKGLFILDSSQKPDEADFFESDDKWRATLMAAGVPAEIQLSSPDTLAAKVPEQILRPWEFRVMRGYFGLPDFVWSLIIQVLGWLTALLLGFLTPRNRSPLAMAVALGLVVDVVAMIIVGDGGGVAFVGLFLFPICFYVVALIGMGVRWVVDSVCKSVTA